MIKSKDISVVVQGAISPVFTKKVLRSVRCRLPQAEIILSTWQGSNVDGLDYDELILSKDPGAEILHPQWTQYHNLNRQIVSTKAGLQKAKRKYTLKIRTDIKLTSNSFLEYFGKFPQRSEKLKLLKERVLVCQYYCRKAEVFPYHLSDWVFFGLTEDVQNIWDIPLAKEPEMTKWFYKHNLLPKHLNPNNPFNYFRHRYCAEQYILSTFIKKYENINFEHMWDISFENTDKTKLCFANNFVILSDTQYGIEFLKGQPPKDENLYTYNDWQTLYKMYCDANYSLKYENTKKETYKNKVIKTWRKLIEFHKAWIMFILNGLNHIFWKPIKLIKYIMQFFCADIIASFYQDRILGDKQYNKVFDKILKQVPKSCKNIDVFNAATGECIQLAKIYNSLLVKGDSLVVIRKEDINLMKLFSVTGFIYVSVPRVYFNKNVYFYKNRKFRIIFGDEFWLTHWATHTHFFDALLENLSKKNRKDIELSRIKITEENKVSFKKKIEAINLNFNKFIYLFPEANSIQNLPIKFWQDIVNKFRKHGYDVFCNSELNELLNVKYCFLTHAEAYLLAQKSKCIIALRSGMLELFTELKVPQYVIYTPAIAPIEHFFDLYTLKKYPNASVDNIFEYDIEHTSQRKIMNDIVEKQLSRKEL